jgi:peptidoglycan-associated lipoprotein
MAYRNSRFVLIPIMLACVLLLASCAKKMAKATPPAPPVPAPTAAISARPASIQQGQSTTLTWQTTNANDVTISGLGTVPAVGSRTVAPGITTTYRLAAKGPGGARDATADVTVSAATSAVRKPQHQLSDEELFSQSVKDVFFDFDKSDIRSDEKPVTSSDAGFLAQHPNLRFTVEGHCDDRGSEEYNLALGESRARALRETLIAEGVSPDRIKTISYGKEQPFCKQEDEGCWQQNRRDHFVLQH